MKTTNLKNVNRDANHFSSLLPEEQKSINPSVEIDFRAMDNPLACNIKMGEKDFSLKGTSHYWGTVYLSLQKKAWYTLSYSKML